MKTTLVITAVVSCYMFMLNIAVGNEAGQKMHSKHKSHLSLVVND